MSKQLILRPDHAGWTGFGSPFDNSLWFQWRQSGLKSGGRGSWSKNFHFAMQNSIFSGNFTQKIPFLKGKFLKNFNFFWQFPKNFDFPGKNWSFTATSGQIILFLFKSTHFRTYFLYSVHENLEVATPNPQD